jgi:hypothetical protein
MITEQQKIEIDKLLQETKDKQKWAEGQKNMDWQKYFDGKIVGIMEVMKILNIL